MSDTTQFLDKSRDKLIEEYRQGLQIYLSVNIITFFVTYIYLKVIYLFDKRKYNISM